MDGVKNSRYASNGDLWWQLTIVPGGSRKFGQEKRISAFLWFEKTVGDTFTMRELRECLAGDGADADFGDSEQLNRRLRQLRKNEWIIHSYRDELGLSPDTYRLLSKGLRLWLGEKNQISLPSSRIRREVFDRDGHRCVVCGIGAGENYIDEPRMKARMTLGHRIPGERLGEASLANLRTECSRCNEPMRDLAPDPETLGEVTSAIRGLPSAGKRELREWLVAGQRSRSSLDAIYDRVRQLGVDDREAILRKLNTFLSLH